MKRNVLVTYPDGASSIGALTQFNDGSGIWVEGHGPLHRLVEVHRCTVMPLLVMTPERVKMLDTLLALTETEQVSWGERRAAIQEARLIFAELGIERSPTAGAAP